MTYANVSEAPSTTARTVQLVMTDGDGGTSTAATKTINVTPVDDTEFFVVNTNDTGIGSLRQAILDANNDSGAETLTFTGTTFTDATPETITLSTGELGIIGDVTLTGTGADKLTLSQNGSEAARIFNIASGATITLEGMTIANGNAINAFGGGIRNSGNLTVRTTTLRHNVATGSAGIYNNGFFSEFGDLTSGSPNSEKNHNGGTLTVINSTLSSNTASDCGGGIANVGGTLTIRNSTISGNQATGNTYGGGAIDQYGKTNPSAIIENSTIAYNTAANTSTSGIWLETGTLSLQNTIVAKNNDTNNF